MRPCTQIWLQVCKDVGAHAKYFSTAETMVTDLQQLCAGTKGHNGEENPKKKGLAMQSDTQNPIHIWQQPVLWPYEKVWYLADRSCLWTVLSP